MIKKIRTIIRYIRLEARRSEYANIKNKYIRTLKKTFIYPFVFFKEYKVALKSYLTNKEYKMYHSVDLCITTKCTLNCEKCSVLIPYHKERKDIDSSILELSIDNFFNNIDYICTVFILGGEVFVSEEHLLNVLKCLKKYNSRIGRMLITTNGTLVPKNKELLDMLKNSKITVSISDYGKNSYNKNNIANICNEYGIDYMIMENLVWRDYGDISNKNRTSKQLKKQYKKCMKYICKTIYNGYLYSCERQAHLVDIKLNEPNNNQRVNLLEDTNNLRAEIYNCYNKKAYVEACNYCNAYTKEEKNIECAKQCNKISHNS